MKGGPPDLHVIGKLDHLLRCEPDKIAQATDGFRTQIGQIPLRYVQISRLLDGIEDLLAVANSARGTCRIGLTE